jgi:putative transposase
MRRASKRDCGYNGVSGSTLLAEQLTKTVIEIALDEELTEHLGYEKARHGGQGHRQPKTVLTETTGPVQMDVPRGTGKTRSNRRSSPSASGG